MLSVIERYLNAKSPEALAGFKSAMKIKNDTARDEALQALAKNFGLGDMFADMQVMAFIRPMLANMDRYRRSVPVLSGLRITICLPVLMISG